MKTIKNPNTILKWQGKLVRVISINEGHRAINMEYIDKNDNPKCPHCDMPIKNYQFEIIESSPLFQENAEAIETLTS